MNELGGNRGAGFWSTVERYLDSVVQPREGFALRDQAERIYTVMRVFYASVLLEAFPLASGASAAWTSDTPARAKVHVHIAQLVPIEYWDSASVLASLVLLGGSILLCVVPRLRSVRILVAAAFILATAIKFDLKGKVEHGGLAAVWLAIGLAFLASDRGGIAARRRFVASYLGVLVLVGTLYTSAGICKIIGTFYDGPDGLTWFHPDALAYMITGNWERSSTTLLGGFLVLHPWLSALCQSSAFVLELGALPAVFFRKLQRPWALALVTMHVMILHSMKIHFHQSCFILILVLVLSPFAPPLSVTARHARVAGSRLWKRFVGARSAEGGTSAAPRPNVSASSVAARGAELDWSFAARAARLWGPAVAALYLLAAFSRFQPSVGAFRPEIYPISPMAMFFRLHPSPSGMKSVVALRERLERDGLFPDRDKRFRKERKRQRAR